MLRAAQGNSLESERKHNLDKKGETTKTSGLACASRHSLLQRYGAQRELCVAPSLSERQQAEKDKYMNLRALAIRRNPHLFKKWHANGTLMGRYWGANGMILGR